MKKLTAKLKLWYYIITNKKIREQYDLKKKMDKFYRKLKLGLWVLYLVDNKMEELGFSREQKKNMRRSYFKDGVIASSFMKKLITETGILKDIKKYEQRAKREI